MSEEKKELETKDKFIKRGENLILKRFVKDIVLKPVDIVMNYNRFEKDIEEILHKTENARRNLNDLKRALDDRKEKLKELEPHYKRAWDITVKECKKVIEEVKDEALEIAKEKYEPDVGMTEEIKKLELFAQWRHQIHTHPKIGRKFPDKVIRHLLYKKGAILTPKDLD